MKDTSVHLHIYYEDAGIYLLEKISKIWNGKIYLSLINNNCSNKIILLKAKEIFSDIDVIYINNKGTDQYGFLHSFKLNKDNTRWVLYVHDKHMSKKEWFDDLVDIFIDKQNENLIDKYTRHISSCGIISSSKRKDKIFDPVYLNEVSNNTIFEHRQQVVRNLQCLCWFKELQNLFKLNYNLYSEEVSNMYFTAGTIFLIRKDILYKVHNIIHNNFFENCYREDGDIGHAMERFYFYASQCMGHTNKFI